MKTLFTFLMLMTTASTFAKTLNCNADDFEHSRSRGGVVDILYSPYCEDSKDSGQKYEVFITGAGLSLRANHSWFKVSCPFQQNIEGKYVGAKLSLTIGFGAEAGSFVGKGTCFVTGLNAGVGGSLVGAKLHIVKRQTDNIISEHELNEGGTQSAEELIDY